MKKKSGDDDDFQDMLYFIGKYQRSLDKQIELANSNSWKALKRETARGDSVYRRIAALQEAFMLKKFGMKPGDMLVSVPEEIVKKVGDWVPVN
jgi:hypothetical protein